MNEENEVSREDADADHGDMLRKMEQEERLPLSRFYLETPRETYDPFRICVPGGECVAEVRWMHPELALSLVSCLNERKIA